MYRHCIFCSADLGRNDVFEAFPVGRTIAFDARKGRLWAVCPRCARWNLAPLEERWETVEGAERRFREARQRVQAENVGMARLPEGIRLVRIGEALPGELAAWRYGGELRRRRVRHWLRTAGLVALGDVGLFVHLVQRRAQDRAILHRLPAGEAATGAEVHVQARHLPGARLLGGDAEGGVRLVVPGTAALLPDAGPRRYAPGPAVTLEGATALAVLSRALVQVNRRGAAGSELHRALDLIEEAGSAAACVAGLGGAPGAELGFRSRFGRLRLERDPGAWPAGPAPSVAALALEMALHDEAERRAMDGELAALADAWREAEAIARIADALPVAHGRAAGTPGTDPRLR